VIRIGKGGGPRTAKNQFSGDYRDTPRISRRQGFCRVLVDRLNRLLQTETETAEQVEEEEEQQRRQQRQQQGPSARLKNCKTNNPLNKHLLKLSETPS
jgi:hypothetical protein